MKQLLFDLSPSELTEQVVDAGHKKFRAKQLLQWIYKNSVNKFSEMKNLPNDFRAWLDESFTLDVDSDPYLIEAPSGDAMKFGFTLTDGYVIESVVLRSKDKKRRTLCISSQVGCALGCTFCETGKMGLIRNLTVGEIVGQLAYANTLLAKQEERITNIVFMGMGEALANFENFVSALDMITGDDYFGISRRKITVSTAGVVPHIQKLIDRDISIELAISLNSSSDEERSEVMPINKRYPIAELMEIARKYSDFRSRPITFEYVLIRDKNDSHDAAKRLIKLFRNFPGKINLIPLNDCTTDGLERPDENYIDQFSNWLHKGGVTVTVRRSGGQEIDGACGQLAGKAKRGEL